MKQFIFIYKFVNKNKVILNIQLLSHLAQAFPVFFTGMFEDTGMCIAQYNEFDLWMRFYNGR
ncbi:hypothetical protein D9M68_857260 [compost metagenome]